LLLEHGANVNALDHQQQTPLMYAIICEYKSIVELLLAYQADVHIVNNEGETALDLCDERNDIFPLLSHTSS
jgi:uncharacterized protein